MDNDNINEMSINDNNLTMIAIDIRCHWGDGGIFFIGGEYKLIAKKTLAVNNALCATYLC